MNLPNSIEREVKPRLAGMDCLKDRDSIGLPVGQRRLVKGEERVGHLVHGQ
jgi:hypothetical protein